MNFFYVQQGIFLLDDIALENPDIVEGVLGPVGVWTMPTESTKYQMTLKNDEWNWEDKKYLSQKSHHSVTEKWELVYRIRHE